VCVREWQGESLKREGNEEKKESFSHQHAAHFLKLFLKIFSLRAQKKSSEIQTSERKRNFLLVRCF